MILQRFRAETRADHERVEQAVDWLRPDLTLDDHRAALCTLLGFYEPWDSSASASAPPALKSILAERRKTPALKQDLAWLGMSAEQIAAVPRCRQIPPLDSLPRLLGSMYVLEGSTLGGQLIARHVEQTLGLRDGHGYSFFRSYGSRVGSMWRQFGELVQQLLTEDTVNQGIESARLTFQQLGQWLQRKECAAA